jgi:hypothetical protein
MASNGWVERPERESIVGGGVRQLSTQHSGRSAQVEARGSSEPSGPAQTVSLTGSPRVGRKSRETDGDKAGTVPPGRFGEQSQGSSGL